MTGQDTLKNKKKSVSFLFYFILFNDDCFLVLSSDGIGRHQFNFMELFLFESE